MEKVDDGALVVDEGAGGEVKGSDAGKPDGGLQARLMGSCRQG